ncbi:MATE family efflux transporter [Nitrincola tibetensis]|uniref:MATE family efflux transporter n=2 Tax=Nitrincola tibetensis TaxID=2219697 RepID=A0A364NS80_9GAMM|nr:MATE family efflux transporter [Nitrincola tibetensis]
MMFGIVSLMLFNLVDIWFVGLLGTQEMAALAFTFPVSFAIVSLAIGLGIGMSATLARRIGRGETDTAAAMATDTLLMTFILMMFVGILGQWAIDPVFVLMGADEALRPLIHDYMQIWFAGSVFMVMNMVCNSIFRARGDTRRSAMVMLIASALNLILDPILIFGLGPIPGLGIKGAALASVLAWAMTTVIVISILLQRRQLKWSPMDSISVMFRHWGEVLSISIPAALSNITTPVANGVLTALVASHGAAAVAAFGVGNRLESLSLLVCLALSMTLPPLISQNYGAGQIARVKKAYSSVIRFALCWQLGLYLLFIIIAEPVSNWFTSDPDVAYWIKIWILIVPVGFGFQATTFLSASTFNALHQPLKALWISLIRLFLLYLPLGWLGNYFGGLEGMFAALVLANVLTAVLAWYWVRHHLQRLMQPV